MGQPHNIVNISRADKIDIEYIGKRAFELGELKYLGIPIPEGFVIKTSFYEEFLEITGISKDIETTKKQYHPSLRDSAQKLYEPVRKKIMRTHIPDGLVLELHKFYKQLAGRFKETSVNIFSSSKTNKSLFFSNIKGDANVVLKIKRIWARNFDNAVAIIVMKNLQSEIKGKLFTDYPTTDKKLTGKQMNKLIDYCKIIQKHFYFPYEIEYAVNKDKIFITKVNPFTGTVNKSPKPASNKRLQKVLLRGISVNPGIVTGRVKILHNMHDTIGAKRGEVIVLPDLNPTMFKKIKNAKAVIVDSILSNSLNKALFRKNFQIPAVEGTRDATRIFRNGNVITVNGVSGEIYSGGLVY